MLLYLLPSDHSMIMVGIAMEYVRYYVQSNLLCSSDHLVMMVSIPMTMILTISLMVDGPQHTSCNSNRLTIVDYSNFF